MVAEKRHDADEEQGRHKEEEQDVELGMCVRQLFLQRGVKTKIYIRLLSQKRSSLGDRSVFECVLHSVIIHYENNYIRIIRI